VILEISAGALDTSRVIAARSSFKRQQTLSANRTSRFPEESAMGASAAAAIVVRERHIVEAFRRAGVTSPDAATTADSLGVSQHAAFSILVRDAVLRETQPGYYYLDEPSWNAKRNIRKRVVVAIVVAMALALAGLVFAGLFRTQS
jgi:hypothetical protein